MERAGDSGRAEELRVQNAIAMLLHLCRLHEVALRHMEAKLDDVVDAAFHTCAWRIGRAALDHRATTVEEAARFGREAVLRDAARAHSLRAQAVRAARAARSVRDTLTVLLASRRPASSCGRIAAWRCSRSLRRCSATACRAGA